VPSCAEAGVLGVLPGIVGSLEARETMKLILGIGSAGCRLLLFDALIMGSAPSGPGAINCPVWRSPHHHQ
jgi:molybdopterin/thiamine biosynthesis adenylyltransferase